MPNQHHRVAHHVIQDAAALQVAAPEPRLVRTTMFLGGPRQVRPAGEGNTSSPDDLASRRNRWREELIFEISVAEAYRFNQLEEPLRVSDISGERLLAGCAVGRPSLALDWR